MLGHSKWKAENIKRWLRFARLELLTAALPKIKVFCDVTPSIFHTAWFWRCRHKNPQYGRNYSPTTQCHIAEDFKYL